MGNSSSSKKKVETNKPNETLEIQKDDNLIEEKRDEKGKDERETEDASSVNRWEMSRTDEVDDEKKDTDEASVKEKERRKEEKNRKKEEKKKKKQLKKEIAEKKRELLIACQCGELSRVQQLVAEGIPADSEEVMEEEELEELAEEERKDSEEQSKEQSEEEHQEVGDVNDALKEEKKRKKRMNFTSPLIAAVCNNQLEVLKFLVSQGCSVDKSFRQVSETAAEVTGVTPLMLACQKKHMGIVDFLLQMNADCSKQDGEGNTVLHYVCRISSKHVEEESEEDLISEMILLFQRHNKLSSDLPALSNCRYNTVLHSLAYFNKFNASKLLLKVMYGERPTESCDEHSPARFKTLLKNVVGMTPLHVAVLRQSVDIVSLLLDYGFDPNEKEKSGLDVYGLANVVLEKFREQCSSSDNSDNKPKKICDILREYKAKQQEIIARQNNLPEKICDEKTEEEIRETEEVTTRPHHKALTSVQESPSVTHENSLNEESSSHRKTAMCSNDSIDLEKQRRRDTYPPNERKPLIICGPKGYIAKRSESGSCTFNSRKADPYPTPKSFSHQKFIRAATKMWKEGLGKKTTSRRKKEGGKGVATVSKKRKIKKKVKNSETWSGSRPIDRSTRLPRQLFGSSRSSGAPGRVAPSKHSRTAHSSQVHRGLTAEKAAASPLRSGAVVKTPHMGAEKKDSRLSSSLSSAPKKKKKSHNKVSPLQAVELPAHIHTSPSGVLTITFS